jgi:hydroxyacylglutathione hydrolase
MDKALKKADRNASPPFHRPGNGVFRQIWLTHAHIDHAGGSAALARQLQIPIIGPHPADQFWIDGIAEQGRRFGFAGAEVFTPTRWLADGDTVQLGAHTLNVRHCPGHTPGHVVFHSPELKRAFVGDVLFAGSIGRTDFPQGDHATLIASITQRLWPMGDDTVFIPGHGPESTFGRERIARSAAVHSRWRVQHRLSRRGAGSWLRKDADTFVRIVLGVACHAGVSATLSDPRARLTWLLCRSAISRASASASITRRAPVRAWASVCAAII